MFRRYADVAQLVEHNLAKVGVAGSNPVVRSKYKCRSQSISEGPDGPSIAPIRAPSHIRPTLKARCAGIWRAMTVASGRVVRHPRARGTRGRCRAARPAWLGARRVP